MRTWDLTTGVAKLRDAGKTLRAAQDEATAQWDDQTSREFQWRQLDPIEPRVRRVLDAAGRLSELLERARRECETY